LESRHANNLTAQAMMEVQRLDQFVVGEDEARMMRTHQGACVAYNVQSAVDGEHGLIVHHAVTQNGSDNKQLEPRAKAAKAIPE
ncbi:IS5/IS1182 family transposase, partial [Pseudomonas aeruginosa]